MRTQCRGCCLSRSAVPEDWGRYDRSSVPRRTGEMRLTVVAARAQCAEFLTQRHILSMKRGNDQNIAHIEFAGHDVKAELLSLIQECAAPRLSAHNSTPDVPRRCTPPQPSGESASQASNLEKECIMSSTSLERQPLELLPSDLLRPLGAFEELFSLFDQHFP